MEITPMVERMRAVSNAVSAKYGIPFTIHFNAAPSLAHNQWLPDSDFFVANSCQYCRQVNSYCTKIKLFARGFRRSANEGCFVCRIVCTAAENFVDEGLRETCLVSLNGSVQLFVGGSRTAQRIDVFCESTAKNPWKDMDVKDNLSASTGDEEAWNWAKAWLENCEASHSRCEPEGGELPTRLLDLEPDGRLDIVRLINVRRHGLPPENAKGKGKARMTSNEAKYACISHCWGGGCSIKTTKANYEQQLDSIPFVDVPKTYAHVIEFLRWLGIRYLWIDSICIVQDDAEDWATESAMMGSVYARGYITIAATGAPNNNTGCFIERPTVVVEGKPKSRKRRRGAVPEDRRVRMMRTITNGNHEDVYTEDDTEIADVESESSEASFKDPVSVCLRKHIDHHSFWTGSDNDEAKVLNNSALPLLSRAWVYQERVLSHRILHFTKDELVWECMEEAMCECSGSDHIGHLTKAALSNPIFDPSMTQSAVTAEWHRTVSNYSDKQLTVTSDRLPAISGLARRFAAIKGNAEYIAGCWSNTLARDLLWFVNESGDVDATNMRFPKWSWIAVLDRVAWHPWAASEEISIKCIQHIVKLTSSDSMGDVQQARIQLEGYLAPIQTIRRRNEGYSVEIDMGAQGTLPDYLKAYSITCWDSRLTRLSKEVNVTIYWDIPLDVETEPEDMLLLKMSESAAEVKFLVLMVMKEVGKGSVYLRIGMGLYERRNQVEDIFAPCVWESIWLI